MGRLKLIKSWLKELPEGVREKALENHKQYNQTVDKKAKSLDDAIWSAFLWSETPEGNEYWLKQLKEHIE